MTPPLLLLLSGDRAFGIGAWFYLRLSRIIFLAARYAIGDVTTHRCRTCAANLACLSASAFLHVIHFVPSSRSHHMAARRSARLLPVRYYSMLPWLHLFASDKTTTAAGMTRRANILVTATRSTARTPARRLRNNCRYLPHTHRLRHHPRATHLPPLWFWRTRHPQQPRYAWRGRATAAPTQVAVVACVRRFSLEAESLFACDRMALWHNM